MFSFSSLFGSMLFGTIGMAAFVYGKKSGLLNPMIIGGALMVFPYFVASAWALYGIGIALTAAIFVFPDANG